MLAMHSRYWECSGNPKGRPILYLHGGPGSGCTPRNRCYFDPGVYKIVLTDQRGCGRSRPLVEKATDLEVNTTLHLIQDLERLREHLRIDRWTVLGVSWGSTLGLAYAQTHPRRVDSMVLACVTTTSRREVNWITRDIGRVFPEQWERFARMASFDPVAAPTLVDAYATLAFSSDATVREQAAREWCAWKTPIFRWLQDTAQTVVLRTELFGCSLRDSSHTTGDIRRSWKRTN